MKELKELQEKIHGIARSKGWWTPVPENGTKVALMHSELSEVLEALRIGNPPSKKIPNFFCVEEELADTIIRILDYAEFHKLNVIDAMKAKVEYNRTRSYKHGGKLF